MMPELVVSFEIVFVSCNNINCNLVSEHSSRGQEKLLQFIDEHKAHNNLWYIAKVVAPDNLVTGQLIKLQFTHRGLKNAISDTSRTETTPGSNGSSRAG